MKAIAAGGLQYNHLNLTRKVTINGKVLDYVYDASGQKLQMQYSFGTTNELTRYAGSVEYSGSAVKRISTADGQFVFNTPPLGVGGLGFFQYNLTDHLGNVRVVLDEKGKTIQRTESNATPVYPFGLAVPLTPSTQDSTRLANKYLYNGKELQPETGNLDYGWRQYDAAGVRWTGIDPHAENYHSWSPYSYGLNNPILYIDPDGRDIVISYEEQNKRGKTVTRTVNYTPGMKVQGPQGLQQTIAALNFIANNGGDYLSKMASADYFKWNIRVVADQNGGITGPSGTDASGIPNKDTDGKYSTGTPWNPNSGYVDENDNTHSPASVLQHESIHAYQGFEVATTKHLKYRLISVFLYFQLLFIFINDVVSS